jgi:hypothetical protein
MATSGNAGTIQNLGQNTSQSNYPIYSENNTSGNRLNENIDHQPNGTSSTQDWGIYGGNPLAHANTGDSARLPPFAGYLQPGMYRPPKTNIANPAPLGLFAFALTTFVLSIINFHTRSVTTPSIIISLAFGYGGLVQLLAGMWEMACGNTFGATALSSYGGFWISFAIVLTPGGFEIESSYTDPTEFAHALSFFLFVSHFLLSTLSQIRTIY